MQHHRPLTLAAAIIVILLLIGAGYQAASVRGVALPGFPSVSMQKIELENMAARYTVDVAYPQVSTLPNADVVKSINSALHASTTAEVDDFIESASAVKNVTFGEATSTLTVSSTVEQFSTKILSVRQLHIEFGAGAAHSQETVTALNYDLRTGREVGLEDIFRPDSGYLDVVSDYSRKSLEGEFAPLGEKTAELKKWLQDGTAPKAENFSTFLLRKEALVLVFNPYQVAPYVFGEHEVVIPWTALRVALADAWQPPLPN